MKYVHTITIYLPTLLIQMLGQLWDLNNRLMLWVQIDVGRIRFSLPNCFSLSTEWALIGNGYLRAIFICLTDHAIQDGFDNFSSVECLYLHDSYYLSTQTDQYLGWWFRNSDEQGRQTH